MRRINLLPKLKQQELAAERVLYSVIIAVVIAIVILLSAVVVQFGVSLYLNSMSKSVDAEIEQLKSKASKSENASVKAQITLVNAQISDFSTLLSQTPQWADVISAFLKDVPQGVKITQFEADTAKQQIIIRGYSPTRDAVIDLYNNINTDKDHFKNINYPLENVTAPTDVLFTYTFYAADNLLIKGAQK